MAVDAGDSSDGAQQTTVQLHQKLIIQPEVQSQHRVFTKFGQSPRKLWVRIYLEYKQKFN